ncbi:MAG: CotH kinase family protein, partial [Bacteroidota bacterium]
MLPKKSYRLRFDKENPLPDGSRTLSLNAEWYDKSYIRQFLSTYLMKQAGLPAFKSSHAVLYVNGEFFGPYLHVRNVDKEFLKSQGFAPKSTLYKATKDGACLSRYDQVYYHWEKKTRTNDVDRSDLRELIRALDTVPNPAYYDFAKSYFDYDNLVTMIAMNMLVANQSTYYHNYFMCRDGASGKWSMLPWDMDKTLEYDEVEREFHIGNHSDRRNAMMASNLYLERAIADRRIMKDIRKKIQEVTKSFFNTKTVRPVVDSLRKALAPYIEMDSTFRKVGMKKWTRKVDNVLKFIDERPRALIDEIDHSPSNFRTIRPKEDFEGPVILRWHPSHDPNGDKVTYTLKFSTRR